MQAFRALFALLPLLLTSGAMVLLILTVLSGANTSSPLNKFYYLSAQLTVPGKTNPDGRLHWTNYNVCGSQNGNNVDCGSTTAAYGFHPATQLTGADPAVPDTLSRHDSRSKITSRTYYAFLLIAIFFTFIAMLSCLAGFFGRLGSAIGLAACFFAWMMITIAASLMTTVYVRGRNYFRDGGIPASLGVKLFAFMWAAVACLLLAVIIFAIGICIPGERRTRKRTTSYQEKPLVSDNDSFVPVQQVAPVEPTYITPIVAEPATSVYTDLPRSSYERVQTNAVAPPIDGLRVNATDRTYESEGTGATYLR